MIHHQFSRPGLFRFMVTIILTAISILANGCSGVGKAQDSGVSQPLDQSGQQIIHSENKKYVPGEIIIKFKVKTDLSAIEHVQNELKLVTIRKLHGSDPLYLMKIRNGADVMQTIEKLNRYDSVDYAEPNYIVRIKGHGINHE